MAMRDGMTWRGPEAVRLIDLEAGKRVDSALRFVRDKAKIKVSRSQPTIIYGTGKNRRHVGLDPSVAPDPPKKVTGTLRTGIRKEFDKARISGRVGTNVPYGPWLELGTRNMEPRPWLRPTLTENAAELRARFGIGVKV